MDLDGPLEKEGDWIIKDGYAYVVKNGALVMYEVDETPWPDDDRLDG